MPNEVLIKDYEWWNEYKAHRNEKKYTNCCNKSQSASWLDTWIILLRWEKLKDKSGDWTFTIKDFFFLIRSSSNREIRNCSQSYAVALLYNLFLFMSL